MTFLLLVGLTLFCGWTVPRRIRPLLQAGLEWPVDRRGYRFWLLVKFGFGQWRLFRQPLPGVAHALIFFGGAMLLLRGIMLFARGYVADQDFGLWLFHRGTVLGNAYSLAKDCSIVLVMLGVAVFFYLRVLRRLQRMTLNFEGLLILIILAALMASDVLYDASGLALRSGSNSVWEPLGTATAVLLRQLHDHHLHAIRNCAYWMHICLILGFLNYLPYCKQFHEITAFVNVYLQRLEPAGRLQSMHDLEGMAEREEPLGLGQIDALSAKAVIDLYSCTECGRCSEVCPARRTGKTLSPKELTVALRDDIYGRRPGQANPSCANTANVVSPSGPVIPEALWACTTCRACEVECPVFITYVDKIVDIRRFQVQQAGAMPEDLSNMFRNLERDGNPWGFAQDQRMAWAEGLDVPVLADVGHAEWLFWVGCAAAYDSSAMRIARATVQLLRQAGLDFAVLGVEEHCTGDAARRAGNEFLFQQLAEANVAMMNRYAVANIVTACPHCFNTLKNEYCDFGSSCNVLHHTELLAKLLSEGRLSAKHAVNRKIVYHDPCYLGRYNGIYEDPRDIVQSVPGVQLVEAEKSFDKGTCCGGGGAQYFKSEERGELRVSHLRVQELTATGATVLCSACPFCISSLADAPDAASGEQPQPKDVAEILWKSVSGT